MCAPKIIQGKHFEGKNASEAKSGETKKHKFHEMLDLLYFYSKNLESRGL